MSTVTTPAHAPAPPPAPKLAAVYAYGEPILRATASPVPTGTQSVAHIQAQADVLAATIYGGGALAAPQAGLPVRMFIVMSSEFTGTKFTLVNTPNAVTPASLPYQLFINPGLSNLSQGDTWTCADEGCMSFPGYNNNDLPASSGYTPRLLTR